MGKLNLQFDSPPSKDQGDQNVLKCVEEIKELPDFEGVADPAETNEAILHPSPFIGTPGNSWSTCTTYRRSEAKGQPQGLE